MDYIIQKFWEALGTIADRLDWTYMIMLILSIKLLEAFFPDHLYSIGRSKMRFPTKYRVPFIGLIMGIVSYWYNGFYDKQHAMMYFQSMLAAMAVYMWFLDAILKKLVDTIPALGILKDKMKVVKNTEPIKKDDSSTNP